MTAAQMTIYTAAIVLSTFGISLTVGTAQPIVPLEIIAIVIAGSVALWIVLAFQLRDRHRLARQAEQRRRALAVEYTRFGQR